MASGSNALHGCPCPVDWYCDDEMKSPAGLDDECVDALLILFVAKMEIRFFQDWWRVTIFPQLATCLDKKVPMLPIISYLRKDRENENSHVAEIVWTRPQALVVIFVQSPSQALKQGFLGRELSFTEPMSLSKTEEIQAFAHPEEAMHSEQPLTAGIKSPASCKVYACFVEAHHSCRSRWRIGCGRR